LTGSMGAGGGARIVVFAMGVEYPPKRPTSRAQMAKNVKTNR
jgi:hypothetical protein